MTIVRYARKTRDKERIKIKTNMAARSFFPARLLLSCFKRISRISETNCFLCSMLSLKGKTAIDRDGASRTRKMFIKWRTDILPQIVSLDRLDHIL